MTYQDAIKELSEEQLLSLAEEAESFYSTGIASETSPLREFLQKVEVDDTAVQLLFLTNVIFRECYIRMLQKQDVPKDEVD